MQLTALRSRKADILALARRHGVRDLRVFGSTVRGEAGPQSDVDFLARLEPGRSLLDRAAFKADLEDLLGVPVDVANPDRLHPILREQVRRESQPL